MDIVWSVIHPGEPQMEQLTDDPNGPVAIFFPNNPDYLRLPPELGGTSHAIKARKTDKCPKCGEPCIHYLPDGVQRYAVAECINEGLFWWYKF